MNQDDMRLDRTYSRQVEWPCNYTAADLEDSEILQSSLKVLHWAMIIRRGRRLARAQIVSDIVLRELRRTRIRRSRLQTSPSTSLGDLGASLHTSRGRKRKLRLRAPARVRHTPDHAAEVLPVPLPILLQIPIAPQSLLKRLCSRGVDPRRPKGPNRGDNSSNRLPYTSRSGRPGFLYQTGGVNS